jgi:uncharacterized protein (TIGR02001 family)
MKTLKFSLLAAVGAMSLGTAAHAQDESKVSFAFNVGAASDYVFRGVSQTDEDPQVFGGADATFGIFYAGVWLSNVDFGPGDANGEYDLYIGAKPVLGAVTFDFAAIRYSYFNEAKASDWTYWEFKGAASVAVGPATLGAAVFYSPDFTGPVSDDDATYFEVNAAFGIPNTKASISGALGYQTIEGPGNNYTTWNVGVGYAITDHIAIDVRYHDTDVHSFGKLYDSRAVASIKATF